MLCVVRFIGGLGNQMFQYALFQVLKERGNDVRADLRLAKHSTGVPFCLDSIFGIHICEATEEELQRAGDRAKGIFAKKLWLLRKHIRKFDFCGQSEEEIYMFRNEWVNVSRPTFFEGYWQNHCFADMVKGKITEEFTFAEANDLDSRNKEFLRYIERTNSVSIHLRRGDYLWKGNEKFQGLCNKEYYEKAMRYMENHLKNITFFVFSDDIKWCMENLQMRDNIVFVEGNNKSNRNHIDMFLMSKCKHNIIANSSYSYWGAYLNNNPQKIVVCPPKFLNVPTVIGNGCPDEWVRI